jgi:4-hydroxybenzoate polyprenyltransferase
VLVGGWALGIKTWVCILLYAVNNLLYTFRLKHLPLLDVGSIAIGFVLRLLAGVYAVEESPSAWITLCTFFLALFLGFAKRRTELAGLGETLPDTQRPVLAQYTLPWLDSLVAGAATMTVMSYALFTTISGKNPTLVLTVPIVYYAIMHYKLQLLLAAGTEEPEKMLLKDGVIRLSVLLWLLCYLVIVYGDVRLFH